MGFAKREMYCRCIYKACYNPWRVTTAGPLQKRDECFRDPYRDALRTYLGEDHQ